MNTIAADARSRRERPDLRAKLIKWEMRPKLEEGRNGKWWDNDSYECRHGFEGIESAALRKQAAALKSGSLDWHPEELAAEFRRMVAEGHFGNFKKDRRSPRWVNVLRRAGLEEREKRAAQAAADAARGFRRRSVLGSDLREWTVFEHAAVKGSSDAPPGQPCG